MYYPDLSPYDYAHPFVLEGVLTVGWLDHLHDFLKGDVSASVVSKLAQILLEKRDVRKMRGICECALCPLPAPPTPSTPWHPEIVYAQIHGQRKLLGMSEIWIPGPTGIIYAAPSMIYHYITEHQYKPPQEYLDAVEAFDLSSNWDGEQAAEEIFQRQLQQRKSSE